MRVATGDLNGDGRPDIVTANSTGNSFSVFLNDGGDSFMTEPTVPAGTLPRSLRLADLDGDGRLDIVAPNNDSNVAVALGKGDGSFARTAFYPTGATPLDAAVGDLNGDGRNDVTTTSYGKNQVDVLTQSAAPPVTPSAPAASAASSKTAGAGTTAAPVARSVRPSPGAAVVPAGSTRPGARSVANGPAAAAFASSIPSPTQTTPKQLAEDSLLALVPLALLEVPLALLEVPVTLVNQTSKHNYSAIVAGVSRLGGRMRLPAELTPTLETGGPAREVVAGPVEAGPADHGVAGHPAGPPGGKGGPGPAREPASRRRAREAGFR